MGRWEWHARVESPEGARLGTAFLVTPRHLLTCAHVVGQREEARLVFPGLGEPLTAAVRRCSDWARKNDPGDVAVLELASDAAPQPARLAGPEELEGPMGWGKVDVCGFPKRSDDDERYAAAWIASNRRQRGGEWWQLHSLDRYLLEPGYSGGPVYALVEDADGGFTGRVVGMVTDVEPDDERKRGVVARMLPVGTLRRYWEELDDHLPLTWLNADARRELRRILTGTEPGWAALARVLDLRPATRPRSGWDAARYVAEGFGEERLARYLAALTPSVPGLAEWRRRHLPGPAPAHGGGRAEPASIIVRLERLTHDHEITVQTWIDGVTGPASDPVRVTADRDVQGAVERGVAAVAPVVDERDDHDWIIEFAVPANWLGKPFEDWFLNRARQLRMRRYPVVVRDVTRLRPGPFVGREVRRRWKRLRDPGNPHPVDCRPPSPADFRTLLEAHDHLGVLVYGSPPGKAHLQAALDMAVPVMLWPRGKCTAADHTDCDGHRVRRALVGHVTEVEPQRLPEVVYRLRKDALKARGEPHCGRGLTLLWDDPSRLPDDPPLAMPLEV